MKRARHTFTFFISVAVSIFLVLACFETSLWAEEEKEKRPLRAIAFYPEYPGVVVPAGEDVSMDLKVENRGRSDEEVFFALTQIPKGWKAKIKTYSFTVTGVHVSDDDSKTLTLLAEPEKGVGQGDYIFKVKAWTRDRKFEIDRQITVTVKGKEKEKKTEDIIITTSYPVIRGPSDAKFEFSIEVENKMEKDLVFNLAAKGPSEWELNFKPAYEQKYISSIRMKQKQSQTVAIEVKPPRYEKAGEYPILVLVSTGDKKAEAQLMVVLTGTYSLETVTPNGLLSLTAQRGKPANISVYVKNTGSATNSDISFVSFKPENWKVSFNPERLDAIEPGDFKQVEVTITPAEEALVGDYSTAMNVKGEKASDDIEFRVTVKASTTWGWVGIGIIIVVIAGLCGLFVYLGRR
jgi:uncharacterized membrane protein